MIPEQFIPKKIKKSNLKELGNPKKKVILESLALNEKEIGYRNRVIDELLLDQRTSKLLWGLTADFVERVIKVQYYNNKPQIFGYQYILLAEYTSESCLEEDFPNILEAGAKYGIFGKCLYKDNIIIFIQDGLSSRSVFKHYQNLGFKKLEPQKNLIK